MYGCTLCRPCVCGDFRWMGGAVAGVGWGRWGTLCWVCPGGMTRVEVGLGWSGLETLHRVGALEGQQKLKAVKTEGSQGSLCIVSPGKTVKAKVGAGQY